MTIGLFGLMAVGVGSFCTYRSFSTHPKHHPELSALNMGIFQAFSVLLLSEGFLLIISSALLYKTASVRVMDSEKEDEEKAGTKTQDVLCTDAGRRGDADEEETDSRLDSFANCLVGVACCMGCSAGLFLVWYVEEYATVFEVMDEVWDLAKLVAIGVAALNAPSAILVLCVTTWRCGKGCWALCSMRSETMRVQQQQLADTTDDAGKEREEEGCFVFHGSLLEVSPKHTVTRAKELSLTGWVKNTAHGSVIGHMEGSTPHIQNMQVILIFRSLKEKKKKEGEEIYIRGSRRPGYSLRVETSFGAEIIRFTMSLYEKGWNSPNEQAVIRDVTIDIPHHHHHRNVTRGLSFDNPSFNADEQQQQEENGDENDTRRQQRHRRRGHDTDDDDDDNNVHPEKSRDDGKKSEYDFEDDAEDGSTGLRKWFPGLFEDWRGKDWRDFLSDFVPGIPVGISSVPQGIVFAELSNLPVQTTYDKYVDYFSTRAVTCGVFSAAGCLTMLAMVRFFLGLNEVKGHNAVQLITRMYESSDGIRKYDCIMGAISLVVLIFLQFWIGFLFEIGIGNAIEKFVLAAPVKRTGIPDPGWPWGLANEVVDPADPDYECKDPIRLLKEICSTCLGLDSIVILMVCLMQHLAVTRKFAVVVLLALHFFTPYMRYIPKPALGGIVFCGMFPMVMHEEAKKMWRANKSGLLFGIKVGFLLGVCGSFLNTAVLAGEPAIRIENLRLCGDKSVAILKPSGSLIYPSANKLVKMIQRLLGTFDLVVIDCSHVMEVDYTVIDCMLSNFGKLQKVYFVNVTEVLFAGLAQQTEFMIFRDKDEDWIQRVSETLGGGIKAEHQPVTSSSSAHSSSSQAH
ncbi:unnamed protein product [Notodromas monacha]|uniref:Acylphosphatase n=1 Tax=Notodromas monacha TaxID=399045 RepID=A0A7R9GG61_9CRUS|nr:unnamed protein product [Notodromas monacha]CAG0921497.1 unnamed protein product [Notodromas monacha]